jgi:hypothetical protein
MMGCGYLPFSSWIGGGQEDAYGNNYGGTEVQPESKFELINQGMYEF